MLLTSVTLTLQMWKLGNRILTCFVQGYKPVLLTIGHMWQVPEQQLGALGKESTIIVHNRDLKQNKTVLAGVLSG